MTVGTYLQQGVGFFIIGTRPVNEPQFLGTLCLEFTGRVMVGLDAREGGLGPAGCPRVWSNMVMRGAHSSEGVGGGAIFIPV